MLFLFLETCAGVAGNVQLGAARFGRSIALPLRLTRRLGLLLRMQMLALSFRTQARFSNPASFILGVLTRFFIGEPTRFSFFALALSGRCLTCLRFGLLAFQARLFVQRLLGRKLLGVQTGVLSGRLSNALLGCLGGALADVLGNFRLERRTLGDRLFTRRRLPTAGLLFEHAAIEVRLLGTDFDVDHARTALRRGDFDFALGFALERDLARRRRVLVTPMRTPQERQQFHLGVIADRRIRAGHLNSGFIKLRQQALDGHFQYLGKLANSHIRHRTPSSPAITTPLKLVAPPRNRTSAYVQP